MSALKIRQEWCKSCGYCINACPQQALRFSDSLNKNGYNFPIVREEVCRECGICYTVCPDWVFDIVA